MGEENDATCGMSQKNTQKAEKNNMQHADVTLHFGSDEEYFFDEKSRVERSVACERDSVGEKRGRSSRFSPSVGTSHLSLHLLFKFFHRKTKSLC